MAYYIRGSGKPLFLINGFISTMGMWDPALLDRLARKYQLIIFDNRGVGFSTDTTKNNTTMQQMADDAAGLMKSLGYQKANILAWSMGARIGQQLLIRHPDLIEKAILCSANPGGLHQVKPSADTESKLNNPNVPPMGKIGLVFTDDVEGKLAAKNCLARMRVAARAGIIPDDFTVTKETTIRQTRARTTLWNRNTENFRDLKNIKRPVLLSDGREDIVDMPRNSVNMANQIPFAWTAFLTGGHAFLFQSYKQFAELVCVFLQ